MYIGYIHEQPPDQGAAVIFDHDDDGTLIDGQMCLCIPAPAFAKAVGKAIGAPDPAAEVIIKMFEGLHAVFRSIRKGGKGGGGLLCDFPDWIDDLGSQEQAFGDYNPNRYGWSLKDNQPITPIECKGALGLWNLPEDVEAKARAQLNQIGEPIG